LGVSAFDKTPLRNLIAQDQKNQNVKEQKLLNLFDELILTFLIKKGF